MSEHGRPQERISLKLPTFRFRGKVTLGFATVLAITAVSMGIAYLGFERVSGGVATYRASVSEADLARNIDRELISYQALARRRGSTRSRGWPGNFAPSPRFLPTFSRSSATARY
jgi:hypothetical protein